VRHRAILFAVLAAMMALSVSCFSVSLERVYADDTGDTAYDVAVGGGHAYVACNGGVTIYDVSDPEAPQLLTEPGWMPGAAFGLSLVDSTLFVAAPENGLIIADVSDPANPEILAQHGSHAGSVVVHRDVAYVSGYSKLLELVDVSDLFHPVTLAELGWTYANGVGGKDDNVYVTDPSRGALVFDVSNPASPRQVRVLPGTDSAYRIEVRGDWMYVAQYAFGVRVFDISSPQYPLSSFYFPHSGEAWDASGEYPIVCVADLQEGLEILDATAPYAARMIASDDSVAPHALAYADGYVHLADQDEGYVVFRLTIDP